MHKTILFCLWLLLVTGLPVSGEYYQYQDAQGNLRFTDDIANVPENQRTDITAFESVQSDDFTMPETETPPRNTLAPDPLKKDDASKDTREELDKMRANLEQAAESINARRKALEANRPADNAPDAERKAYFEKVSALNADLRSFKQQQQEYNEKVKAFNSRIPEK